MRRASSFSLALLLILSACGGNGPNSAEPAAPTTEAAPDKLLVYTVNEPLSYFAMRALISSIIFSLGLNIAHFLSSPLIKTI